MRRKKQQAELPMDPKQAQKMIEVLKKQADKAPSLHVKKILLKSSIEIIDLVLKQHEQLRKAA